DYLSLPVNGRTAAEAIYSVVERAKPQVRTNLNADLSAGPAAAGATHAGIVITVFGAKGGIGKTTISTNLAVALASQSHSSVAIVDMDTRFGDVAIMLDASPERSIADAARDVDKLDRMTIRGYMTRHESGVAILPAPTNPTDWDVVSPEQVERIVHLLAQTHDYVILDTPGAFNELVATSLDLATVVLLITSLELASIKDTSVVLSMLRSWSFPEEKVRLTVNHSNLASSVKESDIARTLDYPIFWSIPYDESVMKASQVGKPIVLYQPNSKATNNIMHLASLVGGTPIKVNKPVRAGFFGKLLNFAGARA
ncbi:MAG: AAA family ATPase, partial [Dehalococcoidia bacterium]